MKKVFKISIFGSLVLGCSACANLFELPKNTFEMGNQLSNHSENLKHELKFEKHSLLDKKYCSPDKFNLGLVNLDEKNFSKPPSKKIFKGLDLKLTPEVEKELKIFAKKNRVSVQDTLFKKKKYYPEISTIFDSHGVPRELLNLAGIESEFKKDASSHRGAVGMWQFVRSTAKQYGLKTTPHKDERKDVKLSSIAAARHLRDLYETFGDWYLALAAYNAGVGSIKKVLAETKANDFWKLLKTGKLNRETSRFIPKFIAMTLISQDPEKYGLTELAKIEDLDNSATLLG